MKKLTLIIALSLLIQLNAIAQVSDLLDKNEIISNVTNKYKNIGLKTTTSLSQLKSLYNVEVDDESDNSDFTCVSKALKKSTDLIEKARIVAGMKMSAKTTISLFAKAFGGFGFAYAEDGVKLLELMDNAVEAGGDSEDYARAIAQFAYDKGSGKLFDKIKGQFPEMLTDETIKGQALEQMADELKSKADDFMTSLISPEKKELFNHSCKGDPCNENYSGTLQKNDDLVDDHVGPVLVLVVNLSCICDKAETRPLRKATVTYTIPLDLISNPAANNQFFWQSIPDYKYVTNMKKASVLVKSDCCDQNDEKEDGNISWFDPEKDNFISIGTGSYIDFDGAGFGYTINPSLGGQFNVIGSHHVGLEVGPIFSGYKGETFKSRNSGFGVSPYYLFDIVSFFSGNLILYGKSELNFAWTNLKQQNLSMANPDWIKVSKNFTGNLAVAPGVRFERISWAINAEVSAISYFTNQTESLINPSTFSKSFLVLGPATQPVNLRFLWRLK